MKTLLEEQGYLIIDDVFTEAETENMIALIDAAHTSGSSFRKTTDLFAIRRFLKEIPALLPALLTDRFREVLDLYGTPGSFITKSIYFDKPEQSNWFVAYHQDLSISVDKKLDIPGFGPWTVKQDQYAVQPPLPELEQTLTLRIHLDDTDSSNGALKVIPGSHSKGLYRSGSMDMEREKEEVCSVRKGGVMLMKPLLLHASARSTGAKRRRVIHLECSSVALLAGLNWSEKIVIPAY